MKFGRNFFPTTTVGNSHAQALAQLEVRRQLHALLCSLPQHPHPLRSPPLSRFHHRLSVPRPRRCRRSAPSRRCRRGTARCRSISGCRPRDLDDDAVHRLDDEPLLHTDPVRPDLHEQVQQVLQLGDAVQPHVLLLLGGRWIRRPGPARRRGSGCRGIISTCERTPRTWPAVRTGPGSRRGRMAHSRGASCGARGGQSGGADRAGASTP
jgi:hypothetical protein